MHKTILKFFIVLAVFGVGSFLAQPSKKPLTQAAAPQQSAIAYTKVNQSQELPGADHILLIVAPSTKESAAATLKELNTLLALAKNALPTIQKMEICVKFQLLTETADSQEFVARIFFNHTADAREKENAIKVSARVYGHAETLPADLKTLLFAALTEKTSYPWAKIAGIGTATGVAIGCGIAITKNSASTDAPIMGNPNRRKTSNLKQAQLFELLAANPLFLEPRKDGLMERAPLTKEQAPKKWPEGVRESDAPGSRCFFIDDPLVITPHDTLKKIESLGIKFTVERINPQGTPEAVAEQIILKKELWRDEEQICFTLPRGACTGFKFEFIDSATKEFLHTLWLDQLIVVKGSGN